MICHPEPYDSAPGKLRQASQPFDEIGVDIVVRLPRMLRKITGDGLEARRTVIAIGKREFDLGE